MKLYGHVEVREINTNLMYAKKKLISYKKNFVVKIAQETSLMS